MPLPGVWVQPALIAVLPHGKFHTGLNRFPPELAGETWPPPVEVVTAHEAFSRCWDGDAHFLLYLTADFDAREPFFRINMGALPDIRAKGSDVLVHWIALDWDTGRAPSHEPWTAERFNAFMEQVEGITRAGGPFARRLADVAFSYSTKKGWRWVWRLSQGVPADEAERKIRGLVSEALQAGLAVDHSGSVLTWKQPFRLPCVVRDLNEAKEGLPPDVQRTWEDGFFCSLVADPTRSIDPSTIESLGPLASTAATDVNVSDGVAPSPSDMHDLMWRPGARGSVMTEFHRKMKGELMGQTYFPYVFDMKRLDMEPGTRHETVNKWVLSAINHVFSKGYTVEQAFALFHHLASDLAEGRKSFAEAYREIWRSCAGGWRKLSAEKVEKEAKEAKAKAEAKARELDGAARIIAGVRAWFPGLPADPVAAWAWIRRRLILRARGGRYYVMSPSGWYSCKATEADGILPRVNQLRMTDHIPVTDADGNPIKKDVLLANYVTNVEHVVSRPNLEGGYLVNPEKDEGLILATVSYRRRTDLPAEFSPDVDAWLGHLGSDQYDLLCRHIGCFLAFERGGVAAMSFNMEPGAGKKLLVHGFLECLEEPELATGDDLVQRFNSKLATAALLSVNEGLPERDHHNHASDVIRRVITGDYIQTEGKHKDAQQVKVSIRVILTANHTRLTDAIFDGRDLSLHEQEAIGRRLVHYNGGPAAAFLKQKNAESLAATGRIWTEGWIEGDAGEPSRFVVAKHFMWLWEQHGRDAKLQGRLLIEGDPRQEVVQRGRTQGGSSLIVIEAITKLVNKGLGTHDGQRGVKIKDGQLFVTVGAILDFWREEMRGHERLTSRKVGDALKGLVVGQYDNKARKIDGDVRKWKEIDVVVISKVAEENGWMNPTMEKLLQAQATLTAAGGHHHA